MYDCGCSEEYGPCEGHADVLVIRQGAALRTADELSLLLVSDLIDCGVKLSEIDMATYSYLDDALTNAYDPHTGLAHFADENDAQDASDLAQMVEQDSDGLWIAHDDGYVISRPHDDCPLLEG